ncbi:MAG: hypothetical protein ABJZ55_15135 [Fuerstiella sp.]
MGDVVDGFLSKGHLEGRLGCRQFQFEFDLDVLEAARFGMGCDGGVFKHCHRMLQENGYMDTHERLVVMLDQQFGGELPAAEVRAEILERLKVNGWGDDRADVVVIDPELEVWIWQDSPHVQTALGYNGTGSLRDALKDDDRWPEGSDKPNQPKDLIKQLCREHRTPYSSAIYRDVVEMVSAQHCQDPAFRQLTESLRRWFPIGGDA